MRFIIVVFLFSAFLFADEEPKQSSGGSDAEFHIDKNLVNELYKQTIDEGKIETTVVSGSVSVRPQLSYFVLSEFRLTNDYFQVPYSDGFKSMPLLNLNIALPLSSLGRLDLLGQARVGYMYRETLLTAAQKSSGASRTDSIKLHWLPFSLGLKTAYNIKGLTFIKPSLTFGAGAQWFYQSGNLDGIEQGFWVPLYFGGAHFTFFDETHKRNNWFGGVTLGASYQNSFASDQVFRGWSIDADVSLQL